MDTYGNKTLPSVFGLTHGICTHIFFRCRDCGAVLEEYDEETLGLAVVVLSMFIHLSPDLAAPLLLDTLQSVGRYANRDFQALHTLVLNSVKNSRGICQRGPI